jgi:hypothetical protein
MNNQSTLRITSGGNGDIKLNNLLITQTNLTSEFDEQLFSLSDLLIVKSFKPFIIRPFYLRWREEDRDRALC